MKRVERTNQPLRNRFRSERRLRSQLDFTAIYEQGKVLSDPVLVVHARLSTHGRGRIGISVSKRVGNSPTRNRWKRLIREAYRTQQAEIPEGLDLIVRPRMGASPNYFAIRKSLVSLAKGLKRRWTHSPPSGTDPAR